MSEMNKRDIGNEIVKVLRTEVRNKLLNKDQKFIDYKLVEYLGICGKIVINSNPPYPSLYESCKTCPITKLISEFGNHSCSNLLIKYVSRHRYDNIDS
jgi:hypothetical protein